MRYPPTTPGPLTKLFALLLSALLLALGFMFSLLLFAVLLVAGACLWAYLFWRTRHLRKAMRAAQPPGQIFEGEAIVVDEVPGQAQRLPPDAPDRGR